MPCAGFLTNASVPAPPTACCDGFDPFVANRSSAPLLCLCHIATADIARLLPAPMNHTRAASVMEDCGLGLPIDALSRFCRENSESYYFSFSRDGKTNTIVLELETNTDCIEQERKSHRLTLRADDRAHHHRQQSLKNLQRTV